MKSGDSVPERYIATHSKNVYILPRFGNFLSVFLVPLSQGFMTSELLKYVKGAKQIIAYYVLKCILWYKYCHRFKQYGENVID